MTTLVVLGQVVWRLMETSSCPAFGVGSQLQQVPILPQLTTCFQDRSGPISTETSLLSRNTFDTTDPAVSLMFWRRVAGRLAPLCTLTDVSLSPSGSHTLFLSLSASVLQSLHCVCPPLPRLEHRWTIPSFPFCFTDNSHVRPVRDCPVPRWWTVWASGMFPFVGFAHLHVWHIWYSWAVPTYVSIRIKQHVLA